MEPSEVKKDLVVFFYLLGEPGKMVNVTNICILFLLLKTPPQLFQLFDSLRKDHVQIFLG